MLVPLERPDFSARFADEESAYKNKFMQIIEQFSRGLSKLSPIESAELALPRTAMNLLRYNEFSSAVENTIEMLKRFQKEVAGLLREYNSPGLRNDIAKANQTIMRLQALKQEYRAKNK